METIWHTMARAFRSGWEHGHDFLKPISPREAERYMRREKLPADDEHIRVFMNGWEDGMAGDTWRLRQQSWNIITETPAGGATGPYPHSGGACPGLRAPLE